MDTPTPREKIEFWINATDKAQFGQLCEKAGYTMAEIMRRATEEKIAELKEKVKSK